jgi:hypothetical protein
MLEIYSGPKASVLCLASKPVLGGRNDEGTQGREDSVCRPSGAQEVFRRELLGYVLSVTTLPVAGASCCAAPLS